MTAKRKHVDLSAPSGGQNQNDCYGDDATGASRRKLQAGATETDQADQARHSAQSLHQTEHLKKLGEEIESLRKHMESEAARLTRLLEEAKASSTNTDKHSPERSLQINDGDTSNREAMANEAKLQKRLDQALSERDSAIEMQARTLVQLAEAKSKVAFFRWLSLVKSTKATRYADLICRFSEKLQSKREELKKTQKELKETTAFMELYKKATREYIK